MAKNFIISKDLLLKIFDCELCKNFHSKKLEIVKTKIGKELTRVIVNTPNCENCLDNITESLKDVFGYDLNDNETND